MKRRIAIAAGALALAAAAAIPVGGSAFGVQPSHCVKVSNSINTASAIVGDTNSGQATNVQAYLANAKPLCV